MALDYDDINDDYAGTGQSGSLVVMKTCKIKLGSSFNLMAKQPVWKLKYFSAMVYIHSVTLDD